MPKTETPSKLYTKKFTKAEWEKLDVVLEIGESKTVQDLMQERYNIEFVEETSCAAKNPVIEYQYKLLEGTLKTVLKANKQNYENAMKLQKKFLMYGEVDGNLTIIKFIRKLNFIEIDVKSLKFRENASAL